MPPVLRAEWGARPPEGNYTNINTGSATGHWEGTGQSSMSVDHSQCAGIVRSIQNYHMDHNGWMDIAYNWLVCAHGFSFEGRGKGHRSAANGDSNSNNASYAVCAIIVQGDIATDTIKNAMLESAGYLGAKLDKAHSDWYATACPGDELRDWIHSGAGGGVAPTPPPGPVNEYRQGKKVYASKMHAGQMDSDSVWNITVALNIARGDDYTQPVVDAVAAYQRSQGWSGSDADGILGKTSAQRLGLVWVADTAPTPAPPPTSQYLQGGKVYSSKMHYGQTDSDSVRNLQMALMNHNYSIPAGATGGYYEQTVSACSAFQRAQGWSGSGADGIAGPQTIGLLGLVWVNG